MKKFKKPLKFYILMFIILSLAVAGYTIYRIVKDDAPITEFYSLWALPLIFILIYYLSDLILDKVFNRKKKVNKEDEFIQEIAKRMNDSNEFLLEDFRRLQINPKFQETLKIGYQIYLNGENENFNIDKIERKFKKESIEKRATKHIINYLKESEKPIE